MNSARSISSGVKISVINGLLAALALGLASANSRRSSARNGTLTHLADLQPLQIGLVHAGRGIRGPTAKRLGHRQPPQAACRGIISTHAHDRDPRGPLNPHILPDAPPFERERLQTNVDHHIAMQQSP
jgi:hypothetical protein